MKLFISKKAENDLDDILNYIVDKGYLYTAEKYLDRLISFANSLALYPLKHPVCRNKVFKEADFRCAIFENTYVLVYTVKKERVNLIRIIHGKNIL